MDEQTHLKTGMPSLKPPPPPPRPRPPLPPRPPRPPPTPLRLPPLRLPPPGGERNDDMTCCMLSVGKRLLRNRQRVGTGWVNIPATLYEPQSWTSRQFHKSHKSLGLRTGFCMWGEERKGE